MIHPSTKAKMSKLGTNNANGEWNDLTIASKISNMYYVVDLSGGPSAMSYPVTTLAEPPADGWTDEHKTTKLVLRRIEAGSILMNGTYDVTISQPFYMGVFEVTQKQYELVMGRNPSAYKGDARPVECVSWNTIRGNSDTYNWPNVTTVDANSFMGKIRAKTGLSLDLPTDAQWEYACRAGTTSSYNNGGDTEADLKTLGRYRNNGGASNYHAKVGSYHPNAWGLYDMHGNVWEWCVDWHGNLSSSTDPKGTTSGLRRVFRGGSWHYPADICTSSYRGSLPPSRADVGLGFRLACPADL
jgi:formylglycine-generating enzyme required for sulfatase activity